PGCPVFEVVCFDRRCRAPGRIRFAAVRRKHAEATPYPSDLSDARWELIVPVLAAWRFERCGRALDFAHHPGPDGLAHECGRRARGVASADHLYVKSAAAAWLRDHEEQADFDFARPGGAPIGSVVDIRFQHAGLRVHLDQAVEPVWDEDGIEPVLGVS
ncbi:hypothetical protein HRW23_36370, partial [Streptomyces lunaelactis]|nr:hypothetical protein [Streptomyces lunaelactis]